VEKGWAEREDGREGEKGTNHREVSGMRWCREMEMVVARGVMSRSQTTRVETRRRGKGSEAKSDDGGRFWKDRVRDTKLSHGNGECGERE
jgi:hypothetical protein